MNKEECYWNVYIIKHGGREFIDRYEYLNSAIMCADKIAKTFPDCKAEVTSVLMEEKTIYSKYSNDTK